jgi:hypothetical protein
MLGNTVWMHVGVGCLGAWLLVHTAACGESLPEGTVVRAENAWTLTLSRTLQPGEEQNDCNTVVVPEDLDVIGLEPGTQGYTLTHHMLLFQRQDPAREAVGGCGDGLPVGVMGDGIYGTGITDVPVTFPADHAFRIPGGSRLTLNAHFRNATGETALAEAQLTLNLAPKERPAHQRMGLFSLQNYSFSLPPEQVGRTHQVCVVPQDSDVFVAVPHMHERGIKLSVSRRANTNAPETPWLSFDVAAHQYIQVMDSPVHLLKNEELIVECEIDNPERRYTSAPDQMCNLMLYVTGWDGPIMCIG